MKIRTGFVSNSSSSSFICDVSGEVISGYDMSLYEADMYECQNGHTFCRYYIINGNEFEKKFCDENSDEFDEDMSDGYEISPEYCPICTMKEIKKDDAVKYLLKVNNMSQEDLSNIIKAKFSSFDEFKEFIK